MDLAFAIFKYFPYGGLQLDMLRAAKECVHRGHRVTVFTMSWEGDVPAGITVRLLPVRGLSNHRRAMNFAKAFRNILAEEHFDRSTAWNQIPGCDFHFCADNCLQTEYRKKHSALLVKLLPRYRVFLELERSIFDPSSPTVCLCIAPQQKTGFQQYYHLPDARFRMLPPGINEKVRSTPEDPAIRRDFRKKLGLSPDTLMLLQAGFGLAKKGSDLALQAVAALPDPLRKRVRMYFAGGRNPGPCAAAAKKLGISGQVFFPGPQQNISDWMKAADLMLHPAREESAGSVLLESLACGTPVLCSGECGFSTYVREAGCYVTAVPTRQEELNHLLELSLQDLKSLREKTAAFSAHFDFYARASVIADILES